MQRALAWITLWIVAVGSTGCGLGYSSALGFRARQAVLTRDVEAFQSLMAEAADTEPKGPRDNPKKTVLTHFLDLATDPRFFAYIESWRARGWIDPEMTCAIHRAHARQAATQAPAAARKSIAVCLDVARRASTQPDRSWEIDECLNGASFLVASSTVSLQPYLERVADAKEPIKFRVALLEGMTRIPLSSPSRLEADDSALTPEQAKADATHALEKTARRLEAIVAAARSFLDTTMLAAGTARGAMEIEEVSLALGRSFVGRYALSASPDDVDLAWAWIRVMKTRKKVPTLSALTIWDRHKEPRGDVFWYACTRPADMPTDAKALGSLPTVDAIMVRTRAPVDAVDELQRHECVDKIGGPPYSNITGPFPLESIARGSVSARVAAAASAPRAIVVLKRRVFLHSTEPDPNTEDATTDLDEAPAGDQNPSH